MDLTSGPVKEFLQRNPSQTLGNALTWNYTLFCMSENQIGILFNFDFTTRPVTRGREHEQ